MWSDHARVSFGYVPLVVYKTSIPTLCFDLIVVNWLHRFKGGSKLDFIYTLNIGIEATLISSSAKMLIGYSGCFLTF